MASLAGGKEDVELKVVATADAVSLSLLCFLGVCHKACKSALNWG